MVHVRISELRRLLRPVHGDSTVVVRRSPGYFVDIAPDDLDAEVFERLAVAGRKALAEDNAGQATAKLARALELWRADPLPEIADRAFTQARITALRDLHLSCRVVCSSGGLRSSSVSRKS